MRKIEAQTVQAVRELLWNPTFSGRYWKAGNMEVEQSHNGVHGTPGYSRQIHIKLHGNEIACVWPDHNYVWLSDCGYQTRTTKSRLNVILGCFTSGFSITQKNWEWMFKGITWDECREWCGSVSCTFKLHADNWMLKQAAILA